MRTGTRRQANSRARGRTRTGTRGWVHARVHGETRARTRARARVRSRGRTLRRKGGGIRSRVSTRTCGHEDTWAIGQVVQRHAPTSPVDWASRARPCQFPTILLSASAACDAKCPSIWAAIAAPLGLRTIHVRSTIVNAIQPSRRSVIAYPRSPAHSVRDHPRSVRDIRQSRPVYAAPHGGHPSARCQPARNLPCALHSARAARPEGATGFSGEHRPLHGARRKKAGSVGKRHRSTLKRGTRRAGVEMPLRRPSSGGGLPAGRRASSGHWPRTRRKEALSSSDSRKYRCNCARYTYRRSSRLNYRRPGYLWLFVKAKVKAAAVPDGSSTKG